MRVLLTNDGGIAAVGLFELGERLHASGHEIIVADPSQNVSGSGTSMGAIAHRAHTPVDATTVVGLAGIPTYVVDVPPSLIVLASCLGTFGPQPDAVAVGVNPRYNTGRTVLHPSTVGAALTASSAGLSAMAVSCGPEPSARRDTAAKVGTAALHWVANHAPPKTVLNVNVPHVDAEERRGSCGARLGPIGMFSVSLDWDGAGRCLTHIDNTTTLADGRYHEADGALVNKGFVYVTPLRGGPREIELTEDGISGLASGIEQQWHEASALL